MSVRGVKLYLEKFEMGRCCSEYLRVFERAIALRGRRRNFFFSSRSRHTRCGRDWSSDVCSSDLGALAFLDAKEGRLVVLPGDSPVDAWARYTASPDGQSSSVSMPEVVTFVYRTDTPKAPETVTLSDLQQQQTRRTGLEAEFRRFDEQLGLMQRQLGEAMAVTKQDTDKAVVDMRALADDLAAARKFMVQTAQLGWVNQDMAVENANGIRRIAAASQELAASSTKLEETVRQLSERLGTQLKELAARLDAIQGKIQNIK